MPTPNTVTVPVIKAFRHKGRQMSVGESVTVTPVQASILHRQQLVSLTRGYQTRVITPDPEPEPEPEQPPRRRRGRPRKADYLRSDMRAEE